MRKKKKTTTVVMNLQVTVIFDDEIEKPDTNAKVFIN